MRATHETSMSWRYRLEVLGFVVCIALTIGGFLTVLAGLVLTAWLPSEVIPLRLVVTGFAAFVLGGLPWFMAVA